MDTIGRVNSLKQTSEFASRRVLSFLNLGEGGSPDARDWSVSLLPEGGSLSWHNLNLYDIEGRLVFRDKTVQLTNGHEILHTGCCERLAWRSGMVFGSWAAI